MLYVKAIFHFFLGLIEAIVSFPIILITLPIRRYNEAIYGKKRLVSLKVKDLGSDLEITLPNGEKVVAPKTKKEG